MKYIKTKEGQIYRVHNPETWDGSTVLSDKAGKAAHREQQKAKLREWIKPGATVYTVLKHVSKSGMSRRIVPLIVHPDGEIMNISGIVSDVLEWRWHDDGSVVVGGCGMDMGFHLVYCLSSTLFRGQGNDSGYALKHCWL
jgi:hypothetical protein